MPIRPLIQHVAVNPASAVPIYHQIAQQLESAIAAGTLPPGEKIASEAVLAQELTISRPTAHRAYQQLVSKGLLVQQRGVGTHVRTRPPKSSFRVAVGDTGNTSHAPTPPFDRSKS